MHIPTAPSGGKTPRDTGRTGLAPLLLWLIAFGVLATALLFSTGCSRSGEPKITGRASEGPINLSCAWRSGYAYLLRLETEISTDTDLLDVRGPGVHRVSFAQECLIKVTNAPRGDTLNLDLEVLSMEMERAKGEAVALSFNSAQGGETIDEHGYIPVLKKMVGGHLRFTISPGGRIMNTIGLAEWVDQALGIAPGSRPARTTNVMTKRLPANPAPLVVPDGAVTVSSPDPPGVVPASNETRQVIRKPVRMAIPGAPAAPGTPPTSPSVASDVSRALRALFTADLFRTMLEFHFVPPAPVRVGEEWKESGDTPITGRSSRIKYDAACKFAGWQQRSATNCARIDALGKRSTKTPPLMTPAKATGKPPAETKTGLDGTVWINPELGFPVTTLLDKESMFPGDTTTRVVGTNRVATTSSPKFVRERVSITLLEVTPLGEPEVKGEN